MSTYLIFGSACVLSGILSGGLLALIYSAATMSRSQERMQRKVRHAWNEARRHRDRCGNPPSGEEITHRWETWLRGASAKT